MNTPTIKPNPRKPELRKRMLAVRTALAPAWRAEASGLIAKHVLHWIDFAPSPIETVAIYSSIGYEVRTAELIAQLLARGLRVALPLALHHPRRLEMRAIQGYPENLKQNAFGVLEPVPLTHPETIEPKRIDLALLPGVAFDRKGRRLGYGMGYVDRWLAGERRGTAFGLAFGPQIVDTVPIDPWDRPMDGVVTEAGLIRSNPGLGAR